MSEEIEKQDNEHYSKNFTRIPNILFDSYKHISKEEKFLYCSLRCVYWDTRPRYVSLRELSDLTGYSIGALSKMLPRLHSCGLIHAEIRREKAKNGQEKGNPKYHITIIDIWEENRKFYSCSPNEQVDPSAHLVHQMIQACSPNDTSLFTKSDKPVHEKEQDRAQVERAKKDKDTLKDFFKEDMSNDISDTHAKISEEEAKVEEETKDSQKKDETQPASYSPSEATNKWPRKPRTTKPKVSLTDTTPIPLPEKPSKDQLWTPLTCMQLADYYRGFVLEESTRKGSKYQKSVDAAIKLVNLQHKTYQEVDRVFRFMKCLDKNEPDGLWDEWWDGKDVDLWNVGDHCMSKLTEIERKRKEKAQLSKPNSSGNTQQATTPIACMTRDEAYELAHSAIAEAKQHDITVLAQAVSSKNNPDAWIVRIKWDDGKDGIGFPPIRVPEQWNTTFKEIQKLVALSAKIAGEREREVVAR